MHLFVDKLIGCLFTTNVDSVRQIVEGLLLILRFGMKLHSHIGMMRFV